MRNYLLTTIGVALYWSSCTVDVEDRCLKGYDWDPEVLTCRPAETHTDTDTGPAEVVQDAGDDSGATEDSTGDLPSGYLEYCQTQGDCAAYDADYCLVNPLDPAQSACVTQNCTPGSCPAGSICCDCTSVTYPIMCLPDEATEEQLLTTMCDCEG